MTLAGLLTLVLLSSFPSLIRGKAIRGWLAPLWLVMVGGLLATYTRGAWVGFASGMLALLPTSRRMRWVLAADQHHAELFAAGLREALVIKIQNVSDYYWQDSAKDCWDVRDDFPNVAPPWPRLWILFKLVLNGTRCAVKSEGIAAVGVQRRNFGADHDEMNKTQNAAAAG